MYATEGQAKLLRAAVASVKTNPASFRMDRWVSACGTSFCLAGHIVHNNASERVWKRIVREENGSGRSNVIVGRATKLLGYGSAPWGECAEVDRLFDVGEWPYEFRRNDEGRLTYLPTPEQLEARVEHWIRTGE